MGDVIRAAAFAADKHRDQRRKDHAASPYINHPLAVASELTRHGIVDPITIQAALLHDTVEDTETSPEELVEQFGERVASVVMEVTDDKSLPKAERKRLQILHAPEISDRAKLVKLGDKICNARDVSSNPPADWSHDRRREYLEWTREVVDGCRGVYAELEASFDELTLGALADLE
ncbi:MAG: bifunctional (p)ppGpp synthetase/guanosine-3',5'-bis(diphosphate) 3'-pyrophosphohydrolase [Gemmatimonadetes bacterium]|nr:HD domain-containing protein [Gemmatimonadota bacterium]NNF11804.1 bifunctional (p)ppGpp synthetase/guanosine-3',5'-bis(diphosphate) 3'-pyrophosphohydrolase [Gemmatimonadota bacterium]